MLLCAQWFERHAGEEEEIAAVFAAVKF